MDDFRGLTRLGDVTFFFEQIPSIFEKAKENGARKSAIHILYTFAYCHVYFPYLIDTNLAKEIISYCQSVARPCLRYGIISRLINHNMISRKNELEWLQKASLRSRKVDRKVDMQAIRNRLIKEHCTIECFIGKYNINYELLRVENVRSSICDSIL